jgi:hypothetical protein
VQRCDIATELFTRSAPELGFFIRYFEILGWIETLNHELILVKGIGEVLLHM